MKISIVFIIIVCFFCSCKKSFLEIPDGNRLSVPIYFKSQGDFQQAINGAYAPFRGAYSGLNGGWAMGELRSDNTTYKYNGNDRGSVNGEYISDFLDDNTNPVTTNKYVSDYAVIARVNQILALIDGVEFDAAAKNNIKGQALFLRAFAYFDLVQYFGGVPLHLTPAATLQDTALPLSSVDDVYKQIMADAEQAAGLLPDKASQEPGRATSGSAKTLLGNVYVVLKRWADAEKVLTTINGYSLLGEYSAAFEPANKNSSESIFEIQFKEGNEGLQSNFFYVFLPQPISGAEVNAVTGIPENPRSGEGYNIPTPDIIAAYEAGDKRKSASISYITAGAVEYPYIKKYQHAHSLTNNTNDNWPVYRYAEVLLFIAEALNEQDRPNEALQYIKQVRDRAGLLTPAGGTKVEVSQLIMQERRVEFAFENKRWLDLVRWGKADELMKAYGMRVKANPQAYYFPSSIQPAPASYTNIRLLFPIPATEAALNPYF